MQTADQLADPPRSQTGMFCLVYPFCDRQSRDAVDTVAAGFWVTMQRPFPGDGSVDAEMAVRAGLAAVPYLLRQQRWKVAAALVEDAFLLDPSRATAAAVLPAIEQIIPHDPLAAGLLARVLAVIDPVAGFVRLRAAMADAADRDEYQAASVDAGRLIDLCREGGRLAEALDLARQKADYTSRADLGPWTQLAGHPGRQAS